MVSLRDHKKDKILNKQRGNILVMFTIGLFALIAMAALALDGGHLLLNKSRLQNIADAAALHAAKTLDEGGSHADAIDAVENIINLNLDHGENVEIKDALDISAIKVDFLVSPDPSHSTTNNDPRYVRVEIPSLTLNNFLADIMSFSKNVSATALAGPSADPSTIVLYHVPGSHDS